MIIKLYCLDCIIFIEVIDPLRHSLLIREFWKSEAMQATKRKQHMQRSNQSGRDMLYLNKTV